MGRKRQIATCSSTHQTAQVATTVGIFAQWSQLPLRLPSRYPPSVELKKWHLISCALNLHHQAHLILVSFRKIGVHINAIRRSHKREYAGISRKNRLALQYLSLLPLTTRIRGRLLMLFCHQYSTENGHTSKRPTSVLLA